MAPEVGLRGAWPMQSWPGSVEVKIVAIWLATGACQCGGAQSLVKVALGAGAERRRLGIGHSLALDGLLRLQFRVCVPQVCGPSVCPKCVAQVCVPCA